MAQDPYWKDAEIAIKRNSTQPVSRAVFRELIKQLGPTGDQLLQRVFMVRQILGTVHIHF